ncbi:MAG: hypothetical protein KDA96_14230 [Planctomycetaceae bacterium]|nr:hypothetical protein [Planctomycetaceae bacterium]MCA9064223.1 hypothetical protein [Planctomycetaceae bacterium]
MTPLHQFGESVRDALLLIPLWVVRAVFVGSLMLLLVWVLRLPATAVRPKDGTGKWDENLKPIAALALLIQVAIYLLL